MSNEKLRAAIATQPGPPQAQKSSANAVRTFQAFLESRVNNLLAVSPKGIDARRMARLAVVEFANNERLQQCSAVSIYTSLTQATTLGLYLGVSGEGYLVPYRNKKTNQLACKFIPGYRGLLKLIRRTGEIGAVRTEIAYEGDAFTLELGTSIVCRHVPKLDGDRGNIRLVYGVADYVSGGFHFEWMTKHAIDGIRARSQASGAGPWVTDYEQMARKTLIRRMANYLPSSVELSQALELDQMAAEGREADLVDGVVIPADDDSRLEDSTLPPALDVDYPPTDALEDVPPATE